MPLSTTIASTPLPMLSLEQRQIFCNDVVRLTGLLLSCRRDPKEFTQAFGLLKHHILSFHERLGSPHIYVDPDSPDWDDILEGFGDGDQETRPSA